MGDPVDELACQVTNTFSFSGVLESSTTQHPRFSCYKTARVNNQTSRRQRHLELLKQNRFDYVAHLRRLADDDWSGNDTEHCDWSGNDTESTNSESDRGTAMEEDSLPLPGRKYQNQLMLSEWLVDVPADLETEWLVVPAPSGKRSLVVSSKGRTSAYTKSGYRIGRFSSRLPGGQHSSTACSEYTILDCIFNEMDKTYYILDVLCWNGHPVTDCEAEFRHFWLRSKIQECPGCMQHSKTNPFRFAVLPYEECRRASVEKFMQQDFGFPLDGLLFFHRRAHYLFGSTPLVGWLKPYMLPEVLGVVVPETYLARMPPSYEGFAQHMASVQSDRAVSIEHKQHDGAKQLRRGRQRRGPAPACQKQSQVSSIETASIPNPGEAMESSCASAVTAGPPRTSSCRAPPFASEEPG